MKHYIGIDLGTTNSAICSFDGKAVRVWKSPDQNDVTPSAIYIDRRGNRFCGRRAYDMAPTNEKNSATLFKRFMGTSQTFAFESANLIMSPEECSAEILKNLYGYLPEEIRGDHETATVITVPAAFNQVKNDATYEAARLAGIGRVALMQEPVAAIMSAMRTGLREGIFLIYDLGGGTFDVSIAENIGGKVNLLTQGGKEMCGGRDWDRMIFNQLVVPWLRRTFHMPDNFFTDPRYHMLHRLALLAAERAKIELSSKTDATIQMEESILRSTDLNGEDIYLDIQIQREDLDTLITPLIDDTISVTRETLSRVGLTASDIDTIVFVGGPSNYKPLRDKVSNELAIGYNTDINPMTAVAEGASIYAESIDWESDRHNRKATRAEISADADILFRFNSRVSGDTANIVFLAKDITGFTVEIVSTDTGWSSGRMPLTDGASISLPITQSGENAFSVTVCDSLGRARALKENRIVITKTMATIGTVTASHSIGAEVLDRLGGSAMLHYLVRKDDALPKRGTVTFRAGQTLKAGSDEALTFSLWEGDIPYPIDDNRNIGTCRILGTDFDEGIVPAGAEIVCEYEISDSGSIHLDVSIPCIGAVFGRKNYYSRQQTDLSQPDRIADDGQKLLERIDTISPKVRDAKLDEARNKARLAAEIADRPHDAEEMQAASNELLTAKQLVAQSRQEHLLEFRQTDLNSCTDFFQNAVQKYARPSEIDTFEKLSRTAQRSIDNNDPAFDNQLKELKLNNVLILMRQDWFVVAWFQEITRNPYDFTDKARFASLKQQGESCIKEDRIDDLRGILMSLLDIRIGDIDSETTHESVNVIRG